MSRAEFPAKICAQAFERAKGNCEKCGAKLYVGKFAFDHRIPDAMGGKPTLDNCDVLCVACHSVKTRAVDIPAIAKVKRVRGKHFGARKSTGRPLPGTKASGIKKHMNGDVTWR